MRNRAAALVPAAAAVQLLACCTLLLLWIGNTNRPSQASAFNLDTINFVLQEGDPNSMFGFSVALHREQNKSWVIVGAPMANTTQPDVIEGGAVYRCDIYDDHRCFLVPFDTNGNTFNDQNEQIDTKSNQWFGATVASAGVDGPLVACAPRYVFHQLQPRKAERVEPVGTCHIAKNNMREFHEYSPCRTSYWGYHRQGSCQAGFSAALTKDGTRVFIGAPGSYYWQGQIYSFSLNNPKDKVYKTLEDKKDEDDSYLGYSSTTGDFNGDGTQGVAVGKPRGAGLLGKVLIYAWNMTNQQNITGEQIGAYFGYSLAAVDVDGDGLDDLIIGAPMHTEPNNEGKYETGRVYIMYHGGGPARFSELETRDGSTSRARFGLAVCSLADINLDGYGDFAVGAPYDGPSGRGAVYVFYGSRHGTLAKASQVLQADELSWGVARLGTFGYSLAGGIDLDGNQYPDLVVGAYQTDKVLVFRSRPVATMEASTLFETENKLISLDERNCTVERTLKQVPCTVVNSCLKYTGINVPPVLDIEIGWTLDARKQRSPRMFFLNEEGRNTRNQSMRLYRGKLECRSERVYIGENVRDKITPLEVEMRYSLREKGGAQRVRKHRIVIEPVLDQNRGTVQKDSINIQKNCGPDNVCIPDLRLDIKAVDEYLLGSNNLLSVEALITNRGEDAFEAGFYMVVPPGLDFRRVDKLGEVKDVPVLCTAPSFANNGTLKCDIGNPLASGKVVNFKVILAPSFAVGMAPSYDFYLEANSTNPELGGSQHDNIVRKSIGISIKTSLALSGVSLPDEFLYNYTEYRALGEAVNEREIGPQVVHIYEIRNEGPSTIDEAEFFVLWPYETMDGVPLMYLLNQPETHGNIQCQPTPYVNPLNLALDSVLARKSFLDKVGVSGMSYSSTAAGTARLARINNAGTAGEASGPSISFSSTNRSTLATGSSSSKAFSSFSDARERVVESQDTRFESEHPVAERTGTVAGSVSSQGGQFSRVTSGGSEARYGQDKVSSHAVERQQQTSFAHQQQQQQGQASGKRLTTADRDFEVGVRYDAAATGGHFVPGNGSSSSVYYTSRNRTTYRTDDGRRLQATSGSGEYRSGSSAINENSLSGFETDAVNTTITQEERFGSVGTKVGGTLGGNRRRMMSHQDGDTEARSGLVTDFLQLDGHSDYNMVDHGLGRVENKFRTEYSSSSTGNSNRNNSSSVISSSSSSSSSSTSTSSSSSSSSSSNKLQQQWGSGVQQSSGHSLASNGTYTQSSNTYFGGAGSDEEDYDSYERSEESYDDGDLHRLGHPAAHTGATLPHLGKQHLNQGHENVEQKFRHYQRFDRQRRQAPVPLDAGVRSSDQALDEALKCHATRCALIHCVAGPIGNKDVAFIALRTRVVAHTLHQLSSSTPLHFSTMNVARVTKLPYIGQPKEKPIKTHEIQVLAVPEPTVKPDVVPLWIVVLAACAGTLILLLLIYLLSKCGFFERNRPTDSSERQPLNRNGNYHGDEHL